MELTTIIKGNEYTNLEQAKKTRDSNREIYLSTLRQEIAYKMAENKPCENLIKEYSTISTYGGL